MIFGRLKGLGEKFCMYVSVFGILDEIFCRRSPSSMWETAECLQIDIQTIPVSERTILSVFLQENYCASFLKVAVQGLEGPKG